MDASALPAAQRYAAAIAEMDTLLNGLYAEQFAIAERIKSLEANRDAVRDRYEAVAGRPFKRETV